MEQVFEIYVGGGNHVMADNLADLERSLHAGLYRHLHGGDLATEAHRNEPGTDLLDAEKFDLSGLSRRVGRFDDSDEAACFDQSYRGHRSETGPD